MLVRHRAVPAAWPITANAAWIAAICMATATVAVSASQAEAAVELGQVAGTGISYCSPGTNTVQLSSTSETPYVVPDGGGVITRWKHVGFPDNGLPGTGAPGAGALQIWRPSGGAFELVGRSDVMSFAPGVLNDFPTRIPVRGGDVLGLRTAAPTNGCAVWAGTAVGDNAGYDSGTDPLAGDVRTFFILPGDPGKRRLKASARHWSPMPIRTDSATKLRTSARATPRRRAHAQPTRP